LTSRDYFFKKSPLATAGPLCNGCKIVSPDLPVKAYLHLLSEFRAKQEKRRPVGRRTKLLEPLVKNDVGQIYVDAFIKIFLVFLVAALLLITTLPRCVQWKDEENKYWDTFFI
jgi:hypothetical protein